MHFVEFKGHSNASRHMMLKYVRIPALHSSELEFVSFELIPIGNLPREYEHEMGYGCPNGPLQQGDVGVM